jgi:peptidylprolyl isomerase
VRLSSLRAASAAVIPLVFLAACGSAKTDSPAAPLDSITVGGTDKAPTVTFKTKPLSVKATTTKVVTAGKGAKLSRTNSIVFSYALFDAKDGRQIETSFGKGTVPLDLSSTNLMKGLSKGLPGQLVGSRLLVAIPPADAFGATGNTQAGVGPTDTIVFLIDVISASTPLTTATGVAVPPKAGLPTATVDGAKSANITVRKTAVPTKLVVPWRSSSTSLPRPEPSFRSLQWTVLADPDGDLREIR